MFHFDSVLQKMCGKSPNPQITILNFFSMFGKVQDIDLAGIFGGWKNFLRLSHLYKFFIQHIFCIIQHCVCLSGASNIKQTINHTQDITIIEKWAISRPRKLSFHFSWLWYYGLSIFQERVTKLNIFVGKCQYPQRKLFYFVNWHNGELSKSTRIWLSKAKINWIFLMFSN